MWNWRLKGCVEDSTSSHKTGLAPKIHVFQRNILHFHCALPPQVSNLELRAQYTLADGRGAGVYRGYVRLFRYFRPLPFWVIKFVRLSFPKKSEWFFGEPPA